jgi:hypothetical protein
VQNDHAAGLLVHGLVPLLVAANFEVIIFHIDAVSNRTHISWDAVKSTLQERAHLIGYLPLNLGDCASVIRAAQLDVLVYPDIGMDPMSYFLTYSRLAPVQAAWLAHPDTSGVATVDYFLGSDIEMSEAQSRYSETLHRMRNLGTVFVDTYQVYAAKDHSSPRTNLLERARFIEEIGLPRSAHLYVIAQPLDRLHPSFDAALIKILTQDRLGYLLFVDPSAASIRRSWKNLFVTRMAGTYSDEVKDRMLFIKPMNYSETLRLLAAGHVLLDPFPVSGLVGNLQALALGLPVVTWPSEYLGGRYALALYKQMDYVLTENVTKPVMPYPSSMKVVSRKIVVNDRASVDDSDESSESSGVSSTFDGEDNERISLVVSSLQEYIAAAMSITHRPKLREVLVRYNNPRRYRLFDDPMQRVQTVDDWKQFINTSMTAASEKLKEKETQKQRRAPRKTLSSSNTK